AELRPGIGRGERAGQLEIEQPEPGELAQLEEVSRDGRLDVGQRHPHVLEREREDDLRSPVARPALAARRAAAGKAGLVDRLLLRDPLDPGSEPGAQLLRLAGDANERPAGLL